MYIFKDNDLDFKDKVKLYYKDILDRIDIDSFKLDLNQKVLVDFVNEFKKINQNDKVLIIGDYDCDGISSTIIIKRLLNFLNIKHNFHIPSRSKNGYGISIDLVNKAIENHFNKLILLDNGVIATNELEILSQNNIDVLIIDHHEYDTYPKCSALLHPNLLNEGYKKLCSAGLSYLVSKSFFDDKLSLSLSGIATLADMVEVFDCNRYLIKQAFNTLKNNNIYQINNLISKKLETFDDITFTLIPIINAVSRLDEDCNKLVNYFFLDEIESKKYCNAFISLNNTRKQLTKSISEKIFKNIDTTNDFILIINEEIKEGLCGLIANKVLTKFNKPCLVLTYKEGNYIGSARSNKGFDVYRYLKKFSDLYLKFGGHSQALGITISKQNLNKFKSCLDTHPIEYIDVIEEILVINSDDITSSNFDYLNSLLPYGTGFKPITFAIKSKFKNINMLKNMYPKYIFDNNKYAISFNTEHASIQSNYLIGQIEKDKYNNVFFHVTNVY